ncbi:MAG: vWA domain-containing protein [Pseudomonadota bacterium]
MSGWPLAWLALAGLLGVVVILLGLVRRGHTLTGLKRITVGALQLAVLALALVLLWQPSLTVNRLQSGSNALAVLVDQSASMAYPDEDLPRFTRARELLDESALSDLARVYDLELFAAADRATAVTSLDELVPAQEESALLASLDQILASSARRALGAVVLISDGRETQPLGDALGRLAAYGIPVHTIGLGRDDVPEDQGLLQVQMPAQLTPGSALRASVMVSHSGAGPARLRISRGDQLVAVQELALGEGTRTLVDVDIPTPEPGHHELTFDLEPRPADVNRRNNTLTRAVEVADRVFRILYIEGEPRWEYKFLRRALTGDEGLALVSLLRVSPNKFYRQGIANAAELEAGFPDSREELFAFDALIIGSIEAASFSTEQLEAVRDFVDHRGGGLLMLGGRSGLGDGGWGNSPLAGVMPSELPSPEAVSFSRERWPVARTARGEVSRELKFSDLGDQDREQWSSLPALADYQRLGPLRPAASTLINVLVDGAELPLLTTQPFGHGKSYVLATGGTWRWQMSLPLDDQRHETFWRQLLRAVAGNARQSFRLEVTTEGDQLSVRAELNSPEFEPVTWAAVTAVLTGEREEEVRLSPVPGAPGAYAARVPLRSAGMHYVQAEVTASTTGPSETPPSALAGAKARTAIFHAPGRAEFASMQRNTALLKEIAAATGGRFWEPDALADLPDAVAGSQAGVTERQVLPVWDAPAWLLLLVLLKSTEWLLRRRWSVI